MSAIIKMGETVLSFNFGTILLNSLNQVPPATGHICVHEIMILTQKLMNILAIKYLLH